MQVSYLWFDLIKQICTTTESFPKTHSYPDTGLSISRPIQQSKCTGLFRSSPHSWISERAAIDASSTIHFNTTFIWSLLCCKAAIVMSFRNRWVVFGTSSPPHRAKCNNAAESRYSPWTFIVCRLPEVGSFLHGGTVDYLYDIFIWLHSFLPRR